VKRGISIPNFGEYATPQRVVELAMTAEASGWDGFFLWDHIVVASQMPVADPWTLLAAIAYATEQIEMGPMVTPLPRRRPWVVSRQATSLDALSNGRLILGVGIGFPPKEEFGTFGEPMDERLRADMLDEGLEVLQGMWSGRDFSFHGTHYSVEETQFEPQPTRGSGTPIWVAGGLGVARPLRRAARFDGYFPVKWDMTDWTAEEVQELRELITTERGSTDGFDVVISGSFDALQDRSGAYEDAGASWYLASPSHERSADELRRIISAG
jgi:alkanesulfonate monooxygenase SsuD/methylene tetrahydromethanopterin reductase-like flavin-dependent oxidoreductase (luciferase family)